MLLVVVEHDMPSGGVSSSVVPAKSAVEAKPWAGLAWLQGQHGSFLKIERTNELFISMDGHRLRH